MTPILAYYDDLGRPVYDRTDEFNQLYGLDALKVEQCDANVLALYAHGSGYELSYRWLSNPADLSAVLGYDCTAWKRREINLSCGLFQQFACIG